VIGNVAEKPPEDNTLPGPEQTSDCARIYIHFEGDKAETIQTGILQLPIEYRGKLFSRILLLRRGYAPAQLAAPIQTNLKTLWREDPNSELCCTR
jgi:hypothetical protein